MLASVLTQAIDNERKIRNLKLQQQLAAGEINGWQYFFYKHPFICIWIVSLFIGLIVQGFK
jgi:hypothetical protein